MKPEEGVEEHYSFCRICESLCGLKITTQENKIIAVEPDKNHVATDGFSCVKGLYQHEMYSSPDRLERPLKKMVDGSYQEIGWDQALEEIGSKVKSLRQNNGPDSIGMYVGTAAGFSVLHPVFAQGFMTGLGSKSMYSSSTQDCSNKFAVSRLMYGFPFTLPFPDLDNTNCLIIVGANPVISKWSFLQVPNPAKKLKQLERRGGKLFVIDPRKTETAGIAGKHLFIRPGTDVFFYLSFLHLLVAKEGIDQVKADKYYSGLNELITLAKAWTPEKTSTVTGINPGDLEELVSTYLDAEKSALYCSTGVNMGGNGTLAFWLQEAINAISGNLDREGGTLVGRGVMDFPKFGAKNGTLMRNDRSRIGDFGSVNDGFPGGLLADEILTPGPGQVKALFVTGGNPLITMANSQRLKEAFESLDLLVTLDIYQNETGSVADYVLPATDPFQRPDLPFIFPLMLGLQEKPYLQATEAILPARGEQRDEASIYLDLCKASGINLFGSVLGQKFFEFIQSYHTRKKKLKYPTLPQRSILNGLLRLTRQKSFKSLLKFPHGKLRQHHRDNSFLASRLLTKDKKVHLAPKELMSYAAKLEADFAEEQHSAGQFKLITKRAVTTHNSWTHNISRMTEKGRETNYAYLHPDDLNELGLQAGDLVDVKSATATIRIPVQPLDTLMPKVVAVPHGWGHQHAKGLNHANKLRGVNVNILAADGPEALDRISGMAHLTGIPVEISKTESELEPTWSGISA
jgi:anaerobic selenocysteine-containing dehydrogenase